MTTAIVLAGGRSSRMGRPKALLPFDGEPLITHIVTRLRPLFEEIVVVGAPGQEIPSLPVTLVHDAVTYQGPVGGIAYGLAATDADVAFVTSCDSAFLNLDLIAHLIAVSPDCDVVVPRWKERRQPLHAVYRRTVLPFLERKLTRGDLKLSLVFDDVRTRTVEEEEVRRFDPEGESFFRLNTPEEYAEALIRWDRITSVRQDRQLPPRK